VIAQRIYDERQRTVMVLVAAAAILLLILPLVVTFNEAITAAVQAIGGDRLLADWIVPYESRLAAAALLVLGIPAAVGPGTIVLGDGDFPTVLRISWNCVGWQSLILFGLSCVTALQGHAKRTKVVVAAFGFAGLLVMNVVRIAAVGAVAWFAGEIPAIVVHDYGTVLASIAYLLGFWVLAYSTVLRSDAQAG
jgi:exosortase/archaeosortase family protein